ncbi:histidine phosphatase family protein [Marinicrinis sediminis]|uniref:Histidine phosphatase family protein n=1 Tax=Marinicrinis sediminis TaxID=1652465 RepID=A0ABW5RDP9_9BACL
MSRIGLIRHGSTEWNLLGRAQGHSDIPLNEKGLDQAGRLAARLAQEKWDLVVSSDLQRAQQTAHAVAEALGIPEVILDPRLREMHGGQIEGTTEEERIAKWGENWRDQELGIEQPEALIERGTACMEDYITQYPDHAILFVSHGAILGHCIRTLIPDEDTRAKLENTSLTILERNQAGWHCERYNCALHLTD